MKPATWTWVSPWSPGHDRTSSSSAIREHERSLLDNLPRLRAQHPSAKTLVLSRTEDDQLVAAALRGGASGLLVKDIAVTQLVAAVHSVAGGHNLIDSSRAKRLAASRAPQPPSLHADDPLAVLTPPGAQDPGPHRPGDDQPADRRAPVPRREDRAQPRDPDAREARGGASYAGGSARGTPAPHPGRGQPQPALTA